MRTNLLETYSKQLQVADKYLERNFEGKRMNNNTALTTAVLLDNTNRFITESLSQATNRTAMGDWKKFCLNLTNIAVPSLIANDLVIVHPMTSYSGSVAYLEYVSETDKGGVAKEDLFNGVFGLGATSEARTNFTSQVITEVITGTHKVMMTPIANGRFNGKDAKLVSKEGVASYLTVEEVQAGGLEEGAKIAYIAEEFQMEKTPAANLPIIGPRMRQIALVAQPRRIAVKYDQITAFQAKTDYGFSLDKQIAEQACGELAYEIDTEIVNMLAECAAENTTKEEKAMLTWSKTLPVGVSKFEHYNGFLEIIELAKTVIYNRTKKFQPNYMVIASDVLPVLRFVNGFTAVKNPKMNGPYKVGDLDGMGVYVTPQLASGEFFLGLNGSDMMSSAAVYAPYMAIVPTQLLGTPDGGLTQGFSTWYAKALLNKNLVVAGKIVA